MGSVDPPSHSRRQDQLATAPGAPWLQPHVVSSGSPVTVVIVDDQSMVAESFALTLVAQGNIAVLGLANSGASAVEVITRHQPDVLLLEQRLPDGLGTDHLPTLMAACPQMRALIVTGDTRDELVGRAIAAGAVGVLRKTGRVGGLVDAVRAAARGEAVVTPEDLRRLMPQRGMNWTRLGDDLTAREREVLALLAVGTSTSALARALVVAPATARNHIQSIMTKLGAHSRLEAVSIAFRENILEAA